MVPAASIALSRAARVSHRRENGSVRFEKRERVLLSEKGDFAVLAVSEKILAKQSLSSGIEACLPG